MKSLLFTSILFVNFLWSPSCSAQFNKYYSFPDSNAWWSISYRNNVSTTKYYDYYLSGDTVVNSKTYFKVHISGGYQIPGPWQSYDSLICLLREDTVAKKIYASFKPNLGIKDTLLYDFNLNVGDTLPQSYINVPHENYVESIDSILIGSHYRKQFIVWPLHNLFGRDSIVEGVGSSAGLLEPLIPKPECISKLLCFKERDTTVYPYLNDSCQEFVLNVPSMKDQAITINIYPNPSNGIFNVICHSDPPPGGEESLPIIKIYNLLGEQVLAETLRYAQSDNRIDLSSQPNGVYLYRIIGDSGNLIGDGKLVIEK